MNSAKMIALLLTATLCLMFFAACGASGTETPASELAQDGAESAAAPEASAEEEPALAEDSSAEEPVSAEESSVETPASIEEPEEPAVDQGLHQLCDDKQTLTMLTEIASTLANMYNDLNEAVNIQYMEEQTNVHIDFITATSDTYSEQFNLQCAAGTLPDLVYGVSNHYSTGADGAIDDDIIIDLLPNLEEYAPNYLAAITEVPETKNELLTDGGHISSFYSIYDEDPRPNSGLVIRQDWLDDLGLDAPVTYDDWEDTLSAFKEAYGLDEPILMSTGGFFSAGSVVGGYGVLGQNFSTPFDRFIPFYQVDGEVKFGPLEEGYEEYITMLNRWYQKGLFNDDFLLDSNGNFMDANYIAKITTGAVGIASANTNSIQSLIDSGEGENFMLSALQEPVKQEGDVFHFSSNSSRVSGELLSVSTNCENVELAMNWVDLGYTSEGAILVNYGVEGYSYELDSNGNPVFTDVILNNPDYAFSVALSNLIPRFTAGYSIVRANDAAYSDLVFDAIAVWGSNMDGAYVYPSGATMSVNETEDFNSVYSDISTYLDENAARFIIGDLPLSEFDTFRTDLRNMGIQTCIDLEQAALDRYLAK